MSHAQRYPQFLLNSLPYRLTEPTEFRQHRWCTESLRMKGTLCSCFEMLLPRTIGSVCVYFLVAGSFPRPSTQKKRLEQARNSSVSHVLSLLHATCMSSPCCIHDRFPPRRACAWGHSDRVEETNNFHSCRLGIRLSKPILGQHPRYFLTRRYRPAGRTSSNLRTRRPCFIRSISSPFIVGQYRLSACTPHSLRKATHHSSPKPLFVLLTLPYVHNHPTWERALRPIFLGRLSHVLPEPVLVENADGIVTVLGSEERRLPKVSARKPRRGRCDCRA